MTDGEAVKEHGLRNKHMLWALIAGASLGMGSRREYGEADLSAVGPGGPRA
jgi:hypothetical protein